MLQLISLVMLLYSYLLIRTNLSHLPARIPTHFNAAGVADGWGSPDTLWVLLGAQALCCGLFLIVPYIGRRYPGAVHVGRRRLSDLPPAQQACMLPMLNDMAAYLSIVMNLFFAWMLRAVIHAAMQPNPRIGMFGPLALLIGGTLVITIYYVVQFNRAAAGKLNQDSPGNFTR